jgi:choline dehydrogenase-like flavoprotein
VLRFTQARVLGGGSTINAQIYTRGHPADFDRWAGAEGCPGWSFREVLPYFRRSEDNARLADAFHGRGGPLGIDDPRAALPVCAAFLRAAAEAGLPPNPDFNGARQHGAGFYQLTQRDGRRSSTARAFLGPARHRPNLAIRTGATVTRLLVAAGRVGGVEIAEGGRPVTLRAASGVVLAAGAIGSPRLLLLSGIGPADELRALGIAPVHDLPGVGRNLQDHLDLFTVQECSGDHSYDGWARPHRMARAGLRYLLTRRGPAASSLFETGGFAFADPAAPSPDIQIHLGLGSGIEAGVARLSNPGLTLNSAFLRPRSRGTVRLASADPLAAPLIDPDYWAEPLDRARSLDGLRLARDIMRQPALAPFLAREVLPGPGVDSVAELVAYAARHAKTDHHPAGTCRMGTGPAAVVDPDLRLHGLDGLRVCDASVMPSLVSSNTNATAIMIGERGADLILGNRAPRTGGAMH